MVERQIAYLWVPDFGQLSRGGLEPNWTGIRWRLLDEHGRVLTMDAQAEQTGIRVGLTERQAAAHCPPRRCCRPPVFRFGKLRSISLAASRATLSVGNQTVWARSIWMPRRPRRATWLASKANSWSGVRPLWPTVRRLGWQPALGVTGSKFGADVAGQAAWPNLALLLAPRARVFLAGQPMTVLPLDADALTQLRHLGIRTLGSIRAPASRRCVGSLRPRRSHRPTLGARPG